MRQDAIGKSRLNRSCRAAPQMVSVTWTLAFEWALFAAASFDFYWRRWIVSSAADSLSSDGNAESHASVLPPPGPNRSRMLKICDALQALCFDWRGDSAIQDWCLSLKTDAQLSELGCYSRCLATCGPVNQWRPLISSAISSFDPFLSNHCSDCLKLGYSSSQIYG